MKTVMVTALIAITLMALGAGISEKGSSGRREAAPEFAFHRIADKRLCIVIHKVGTYPIAAYKCDENMVAE